jgi:hypothetical protein
MKYAKAWNRFVCLGNAVLDVLQECFAAMLKELAPLPPRF